MKKMTSKEVNNEPENEGAELEERVNFKIFDMPIGLAQELMRYAKEECGNKVWVAIQNLMNMRAQYELLIRIANEVMQLKERIDRLENKNQAEVKTFRSR